MKKVIVILLLLLFVVFTSGCVTMQSGTSRDVVQGWDTGLVWSHAYLKNDHTTVYCFDDSKYEAILTESQKTQKEVIITYKKDLFKGMLCVDDSQKYEPVLISGIEFAETR